MKIGNLGKCYFIICLAIAAILTGSGLGIAKNENDPKPLRSINMAVEYPGVVVPQGENVSMDIIFHNKGRTDEDVNVRITEMPPGWKVKIKTYRFTVTGIHVPADDDKALTFEATPDEDVQPGEYTIRIEANTRDGQFKMAKAVTVEISDKVETAAEDRGVQLTTSYPVIRGPSNAAFEFSLEVNSKLDQEAIFDLFARGPQDWEINFKPAYETKFISSLRLKPGQNQNIAVEVKPALNAQAGEYPITIQVNSADAKGEAKLSVILTGTYDLEVGTVTGLLSLDARQGKPANVSFYIKNSGSAANQGIKFMSFKPENWKVEFNPEVIDVIEPGDLKQVEMTITPYEEALVGDYSVSINVEGEKASKAVEFRTTVKASAAWDWIGIGVIVAVIVGLFGLFRWLGRR
jgi:uncharacterized membrane protein